ncbi:MAG: crossover junction endodeoxyribonuclease RuvC [bacterium]|nr:crossover junction endodeoxyribonuclease RuvC [bacterium]
MVHRILGIDPGVGRVGWGVIEKETQKLRAVAWGRIDTPAHTALPARLSYIVHAVKKLIAKYTPGMIAVEEIFFAKNAKTAIAVSHMRGAILVLGEQSHLPIVEYTPLQVKQAVTGYGRAEKQQVQMMLRTIFKIRITASEDDAADALAIAYTAMVSAKSL